MLAAVEVMRLVGALRAIPSAPAILRLRLRTIGRTERRLPTGGRLEQRWEARRHGMLAPEGSAHQAREEVRRRGMRRAHGSASSR